jgi:O-antigen ligase
VKSLFFFRSYIKDNTGNALICFMAAMIPFQINFGNAAIILSFIYAIYFSFTTKLKETKWNYFVFYFPIIFFIIIAISALTSRNINEGIKSIDKNLLLILIPVTLFFIQKTKGFFKHTLIVFAASSSIATIILLISGVIKLIQGQSIEVIFFHNFTKLYDQHPVYFALNLALSVFVLTHFYHKTLVNKQKYSKMIFISHIVLIIGIFLSASKAVIFIFVTLYFLLLISYLKQRKTRITVAILFIVAGFMLTKIPVIKTRFVEGLEFNINSFQPTDNLIQAKLFNYEDKQEISDLELRYIFFKIGIFHLIEDKKVLFGYGVGDVQDNLDYYYLTYGLAPNWYEDSNIHNQYLHLLITFGVFVFIFFLGYLMISFYYAIKYRSLLHLFFLLMTCFIFIFEVTLVRNKGIVFFYFFNSLFFLNYLYFENSHSRYKGNT